MTNSTPRTQSSANRVADIFKETNEQLFKDLGTLEATFGRLMRPGLFNAANAGTSPDNRYGHDCICEVKDQVAATLAPTAPQHAQEKDMPKQQLAPTPTKNLDKEFFKEFSFANAPALALGNR